MLNSDLIQLVSPIGAEAICALLPLRDREREDRERSDGLTKLYPTQLEALTQLRVRSSGMARGAMPGSLECRTEGCAAAGIGSGTPAPQPQPHPHRYSCTATATAVPLRCCALCCHSAYPPQVEAPGAQRPLLFA